MESWKVLPTIAPAVLHPIDPLAAEQASLPIHKPKQADERSTPVPGTSIPPQVGWKVLWPQIGGFKTNAPPTPSSWASIASAGRPSWGLRCLERARPREFQARGWGTPGEVKKEVLRYNVLVLCYLHGVMFGAALLC